MRGPIIILAGLIAAMPAIAQIRAVSPGDLPEPADTPSQPPIRPLETTPQGRLADSPAGEIGQRRTRTQTQGIVPTARISSRIQNRIQSRLRTRVDRNYDPQADAVSPFAVADEQVRSATRPRR